MNYQSNYGILRNYGDKKFKLVCMYTYTPHPEERGYSTKGTINDEKLPDNVRRARNRIFELAMCNPWELFVTLTLDKRKYDRKDLEKFRKDFGQFVRDYRKKHNVNIKYLLVPERHKDGSWHMHGLLLGLPLTHLQMFEEKPNNPLPKKIVDRIKSGVKVYTWNAYAQRFGFANIEQIQNHEGASKYMTKYITKESMETITELNAHAFYASKGLQQAEVIYKDILARMIAQPDYTGEYCEVKWYDEANTPMLLFEGVEA